MKNTKNFILILLTIISATVFSSCVDDMPGTALVVNYPKIVLNGESQEVIAPGEAFEDPGAVATENGEEIPLTTSYAGTYFGGSIPSINPSIPDFYQIIYSASNSRGDVGSKSRSVLILPENGDLVNSIEGLYSSTVVRNGASAAQYTNMKYIIIRKVDEDTYELSDAIGGYYDFGRVYGPTYAATGAKVTINSPNNFTFENTVGVGLFGGVAQILSMSANPANKTLNFVTKWDAGFTFNVTLTQVKYSE